MKVRKPELKHPNEEFFEEKCPLRFPSDKKLDESEKELGIDIPDDYVWYLKNYFYSGYPSEFLEYGIDGKARFVEETLKQREYGLPENLLVVKSHDEYGCGVYCIDVITNKVVRWNKNNKDSIVEVSDNFREYFFECLLENIIDSDDF